MGQSFLEHKKREGTKESWANRKKGRRERGKEGGTRRKEAKKEERVALICL